MLTLSGPALIFTLLALLALGALAGYAFASMRARLDGGGRKPAELKREFDDYRSKVDDHFATTNELLQGLTAQYREVYAHMASGAQELCDVEPARFDEHLRLESMSDALEAEAASAADDQPGHDETVAAESAEQAAASVDATADADTGPTAQEVTDEDGQAGEPGRESDVLPAAPDAAASAPRDAASDAPDGERAGEGDPTIVAVDHEREPEAPAEAPASGRRDRVGEAA